MRLSVKESQRLHVHTLLAIGKTTTAQAVESLGITVREFWPLRAKPRAASPPGPFTHRPRLRRTPQAGERLLLKALAAPPDHVTQCQRDYPTVT